MSCEQKGLLQRLAVEDAAALDGEAWQEHLEECAECREERNGFAQSLAVFRQLESERIAACPRVPSWASMSRALAQGSRIPWPLGAVRLPVASAVAGLLLVGGVAGWQVWNLTLPAGTETVEAVAPERPDEAFQQWTIPTGQLDVISRRTQQRRRPAWFAGSRGGSLVLEVGNDPLAPLTVEVQGTPERNGPVENAGMLPSSAEGEAPWQPPMTSRVSGRAYPVQFPTYRGNPR